MRGMKPQTFAKEFDFPLRYVNLLLKRYGVRKQDCNKRFHEDDIIDLGPKTKRILVKWQGNALVQPRFVERED